ncbi:hypothetical protein KA107_02625 [Candidatus Pacearchaeota archaeon]|nr:hypothetical protein [Candidatus Pacearchaeota archaeon]
MNLVDQIVDKRTKFIYGLMRKVREQITGDLQTDFKNLIETPLVNAQSNPYFTEKVKLLEGKPFTWKSLEAIPEITGVSFVDNASLAGTMKQVSSSVDNYFRQFLEPVSSLPFFYADQEYRSIEPNCVGASQLLSVLYAARQPLDNLEMVLISSTKRRDTVLEALRNLDKLPTNGAKYNEWVEANVDTFSGMFNRENLRDLLLDHVLLLEESGHVAMRVRGGEIYDHKLERENFKITDTCCAKDGIWATGINQLTQLYLSLGMDPTRQWLGLRDKVSKVSKNLATTNDYSLGLNSFESLKEMFGEDLPIRYLVTEVAMDETNSTKIKEVAEKISRTYAHPRALEIIADKYLGDRAGILISGGKNE